MSLISSGSRRSGDWIVSSVIVVSIMSTILGSTDLKVGIVVGRRIVDEIVI
jgi:hypothetical protein